MSVHRHRTKLAQKKRQAYNKYLKNITVDPIHGRTITTTAIVKR